MYRTLPICLAISAFCAWTTVARVAAAPREVTILAGEKTHAVHGAIIDGEQLLIPLDQVHAVTGLEIKPEGLCAGDVCYFPGDKSWKVDREGKKYFDLTGFAAKAKQAYAADREHGVWSFSAIPSMSPLATGKAPDFILPDREGKPVRLSDYRGKKVVLVTWASWCLCRTDIAGWEKVYQDVKDQGVEILSIAEDTGGAAVAEPHFKKAKATMTGLVDVNHTVSSLYQMVNVPAGVWIDEEGSIVRPAEVAYSEEKTFVPGVPSGDDRYAEGVKDWAAKGKASKFVPTAEQLKQQLALRSPELLRADAEFKLGTYFVTRKQPDVAATHFARAQQLNPDNWNYHRQQWSFEPNTALLKWMTKVRGLNGKPYYDPVVFPETSADAATPKQ